MAPDLGPIACKVDGCGWDTYGHASGCDPCLNSHAAGCLLALIGAGRSDDDDELDEALAEYAAGRPACPTCRRPYDDPPAKDDADVAR